MRANHDFDMFYILSIMFAGVLAGYLLRKVKPVTMIGRSGFISFLIWTMLFILGAELGSGEDFLGSLYKLGGQALVFALAGICGSVAAAVLVQRFLFRTGKCGDTAGKDGHDGNKF